jgi:hypothetical protein
MQNTIITGAEELKTLPKGSIFIPLPEAARNAGEAVEIIERGDRFDWGRSFNGAHYSESWAELFIPAKLIYTPEESE